MKRVVAPPRVAEVDISISVADIEQRGNILSIPSVVANVLREVIREKAPLREVAPVPLPATALASPLVATPPSMRVFTPFIYEPVFSGADTILESHENRTTITTTATQHELHCDTVLLPLTQDVPVRIYLTGRELDLQIDDQRCVVEVFDDNGYTKMLGIAKRDSDGVAYLEVLHKNKAWVAGTGTAATRFHIDATFTRS